VNVVTVVRVLIKITASVRQRLFTPTSRQAQQQHL